MRITYYYQQKNTPTAQNKLDTHLNTVLASFKPIGLEEMDTVKLMNRTDTKFIFNQKKLVPVLEQLNHSYSCFTIDTQTVSTYNTLYFDTDNFLLYKQHHNGILNRYKLRHRKYIESDLNFLEIKFKSNKERTIKTRIKYNLTNELDLRAMGFIEKTMPYSATSLKPNVWINYKRITLVDIVNGERLTIDKDLEIINQDKVLHLPNIIIAELKRGNKQNSSFINLMKKMHIQPGGISKYCLGLALTETNLKTNNFKEKLLKISRI